MNQYNECAYKEKDDADIHKLLKELICDYLVKSGYSETLDTFRREAKIGEEVAHSGFSSLLELVSMFVKIIDTRCGRLRTGPDIHRIEGIMMKIMAEKHRCMQIISTGKPGMLHEIRSVRPPDKGEYDKRTMSSPSYLKSSGSYQHQSIYGRSNTKPDIYQPEADLENSSFKLIKTLKIHQSRVSCSALAHKSLVFFTGCLDFTMAIINLRTYEYSIEQFHKAIRLCKIREILNEIVIGVGFLDQELQIFRYIQGRRLQHVNGIQTPGAAIIAFDFSDTNLYTVDADGKLVVWTIHGKFVSMYQSSTKTIDICYFGSNVLVINESHRIVALSLTNNEILKIILNSGANHMRKVEDVLLVVHQNMVNIYNNNHEKIDVLEFQKAVKIANYINGNFVIGYENSICLNGLASTSLALHTASLTTLDFFYIADAPYIISGSSDGELKVCELVTCGN